MYCGTDIIEVSRIKEAIENTKGFKEKVYTVNEINNIEKIKSDVKYQKYAARFAVKEAIYKAMSKLLIDNNITMDFLDAEIENEQKYLGRPRVKFLKKEIINLIEKNKIDIDISISHINEIACATVIINELKEE